MLLSAKSLDFSKRKSLHANISDFTKLCFAVSCMTEIWLYQFIEFNFLFFFFFPVEIKRENACTWSKTNPSVSPTAWLGWLMITDDYLLGK